MTQFWFARRFSVGHPRNAMAPVSAEGWWFVGGFVLAMTMGGCVFLALSILGQTLLGAAVFAVVATAGGLVFVLLAVSKGDRLRTVADYRLSRSPPSSPDDGGTGSPIAT